MPTDCKAPHPTPPVTCTVVSVYTSYLRKEANRHILSTSPYGRRSTFSLNSPLIRNFPNLIQIVRWKLDSLSCRSPHWNYATIIPPAFSRPSPKTYSLTSPPFCLTPTSCSLRNIAPLLEIRLYVVSTQNVLFPRRNYFKTRYRKWHRSFESRRMTGGCVTHVRRERQGVYLQTYQRSGRKDFASDFYVLQKGMTSVDMSRCRSK